MIETLLCAVVAKELVYGRIEQVSKEFGVSEGVLTYIIKNEAKKTRNGDFYPCGDGDEHLIDPNGNPHRSRGIAQINDYHHPYIRDKDAYNINFAIEWTASKLREGKCSWWTTCRKLISEQPNTRILRPLTGE